MLKEKAQGSTQNLTHKSCRRQEPPPPRSELFATYQREGWAGRDEHSGLRPPPSLLGVVLDPKSWHSWERQPCGTGREPGREGLARLQEKSRALPSDRRSGTRLHLCFGLAALVTHTGKQPVVTEAAQAPVLPPQHTPTSPARQLRGWDSIPTGRATRARTALDLKLKNKAHMHRNTKLLVLSLLPGIHNARTKQGVNPRPPIPELPPTPNIITPLNAVLPPTSPMMVLGRCSRLKPSPASIQGPSFALPSPVVTLTAADTTGLCLRAALCRSPACTQR